MNSISYIAKKQMSEKVENLRRLVVGIKVFFVSQFRYATRDTNNEIRATRYE